MRTQWLVGACCVLLSSSPIIAGTSDCGLDETSNVRQLHDLLSLRAVEVIKRSANSKDDQTDLVAADADFSLGRGDVGRSLGKGVTGARKLAETMNADTYRFLGWDFMDYPVKPCSEQQVEVEFIDSGAKRTSKVRFTFEDGRVIGAAGWQQSFETGTLKGRAGH